MKFLCLEIKQRSKLHDDGNDSWWEEWQSFAEQFYAFVDYEYVFEFSKNFLKFEKKSK